MSNKRTNVITGGKRRTIQCPCGATVSFFQLREIEPWCRRHSRSCAFMRENFHKMTDLGWVQSTHVKSRNASFRPEWGGRVISGAPIVMNAPEPPTVESLIGTVGGLTILDAVEILTRQDSNASQSSSGTISTLTHPETPKPKKSPRKPLRKQVEMIPAEVKLFTLFYMFILSNYHLYNRIYLMAEFAIFALTAARHQRGKPKHFCRRLLGLHIILKSIHR